MYVVFNVPSFAYTTHFSKGEIPNHEINFQYSAQNGLSLASSCKFSTTNYNVTQIGRYTALYRLCNILFLT